MASVVILGAGLGGMTTAMLLAGDGHRVTVLERDPTRPPPPEQAAGEWDRWSRPGVTQYRIAHWVTPRWWAEVQADLPELVNALEATGASTFNVVGCYPSQLRGPLRPTDTRFETMPARRPVLDAAASAAAEAVGVTVRRGVRVRGLVTDGRGPAPHVTGVTSLGGETWSADLVVDCTGRRSELADWLVEVGSRRPVEERADSGVAYYGRHFHAPGGMPQGRVVAPLAQTYNSVSLLCMPADGDTWSVTFAVSTKDRLLRALREPERWNAAVARFPVLAYWTDAEPISDMFVIAGIEDRRRSMIVDGSPVATGVIAVGDSYASTSPSLGRGAGIAMIHGQLLRDILRETSTDDHVELARRFGERTAEVVEPLYRAAVDREKHRLAEIDADIAGVPYQTDDRGWNLGKALAAAALVDPEALRAYTAVVSQLNTPAEVLSEPGLLERVMAVGGAAPQYPLPGPSRAELLAAIA